MKDKKMGSLDILFRFLKIMGKPLPLFLFAMIIHMVGDNLFNVTLSVFVNNVVEMARSGNMEGFWRMLLWCVLAGAAALMIFFVFGAIYDIEAKRGNAKVQKLVIEKALRMPMWYYDENHSGDIVSKLLNDAENKLYDHLNLQFLRGESTAVVGKTGSGKSTLFKLMLGFYPPLSGEISVFGEKLTYDNCGNIRKSIAYIPQKTHLFRMSFKDNIRLGNPQATDEEVIEAAKAANAHDFIIRQPDGYDTIVENGGSSLSGGEQQRIAIARAFIRKAPLLLMDEATSSLDNENDNLIAEAVKNLEDCTVLIIAHKPSTIQSVQHVLSLNC